MHLEPKYSNRAVSLLFKGSDNREQGPTVLKQAGVVHNITIKFVILSKCSRVYSGLGGRPDHDIIKLCVYGL